MPWTELQIERWVTALAALDVAAPGVGCGPPPPDAFAAVHARVAGEQLDGLLVHAIERRLVHLDDAQVEVVAAHHEAAMLQSLRLEQTALRASEVLAAAGVPHLLLKGCALATAVYLDPSRRPF